MSNKDKLKILGISVAIVISVVLVMLLIGIVGYWLIEISPWLYGVVWIMVMITLVYFHLSHDYK